MKVTRLNTNAVVAEYLIEDMTPEEQAMSASNLSDEIRYNYGAVWLRKDGDSGVLQVFVD